MKFASYILIVVITVLTFKPGIDAVWSLAGSNCCDKVCSVIQDVESDQENKSEEDPCNGKACNPFQVCCSAVFVFSENNIDANERPDIWSESSFVFKSEISFPYAEKIIHPPEIVA